MGIKFGVLEMWQKNKNQDIVQKKLLSISKEHIKVKVLTVGTNTTRQEVVLFLFSVNS